MSEFVTNNLSGEALSEIFMQSCEIFDVQQKEKRKEFWCGIKTVVETGYSHILIWFLNLVENEIPSVKQKSLLTNHSQY